METLFRRLGGQDGIHALVDDIMDVLRDHDIDEQSRKDVLMISYTLRSEIMGK